MSPSTKPSSAKQSSAKQSLSKASSSVSAGQALIAQTNDAQGASKASKEISNRRQPLGMAAVLWLAVAIGSVALLVGVALLSLSLRDADADKTSVDGSLQRPSLSAALADLF